ncbi:MAG: hypothetical protein AVDCRST_MAG49-1444, partial [uncultured Thermomicrobiales bacterium]
WCFSRPVSSRPPGTLRQFPAPACAAGTTTA